MMPDQKKSKRHLISELCSLRAEVETLRKQGAGSAHAPHFLAGLRRIAQLLLPSSDTPPFVEVLDTICEAVPVTRGFIFVNSHTKEGELLFSLRAEWRREGCAFPAGDPEYQNCRYADRFPGYRKLLRSTKYVTEITDLPETEAALCVAEGIHSVILLPLRDAEERLGFIALVPAQAQGAPKKAERDFLETAASDLSTAISRWHAKTHIVRQFDFLQALMDMLPVGIYHRTLDGKYIACNRAFAEFVGRNKSDIPNLTVRDLFSEETANRLLGMDAAPATPGSVSTYEVGLALISGTARTALLLKSVVPNEQGEPANLVGAVIDVTERKKSEEALRESEQQLRVISELMTETMFAIEIGPDGSLSPGWEMGGFSDLLGPLHETQNPLEVLRGAVYPEDVALFQRHVTRLLSGSDDITEYRLFTPAGDLHWLRAYGRPIRSPKTGRIARLCCALQDITQQKLAEEAILEREQVQHNAATRIRAILDAVPVLIWVAEDPQCRIMWKNRIAEEFARPSGFHPENEESDTQTFRYPLRILKDGVELKEQQWPIRMAAEQGVHVRDCELDIVFWDGLRKTIFGTASPLFDSEGRATGAVAAFMDITERRREERRRKEFELQLLHTQKLESLGIMAGGIAHDFNNLLMSILGNTGLALEDTPPDSSAIIFLDEIEKATEKAVALTGQLLAYSGKGQFTISSVNLTSLIKEMTSFVESFISKRVTLKLELDQSLPTIEADLSQMRQVLVNIVLNASESIGDQDGSITIAAGVRHMTQADLKSKHIAEERAEGSYVFLEVADSGCGMDEETLERVYDPFFTTKFTGRGLGLAAVLGIVRGHSGMITIASAPEQGTVLRTYFPVVRKPAATRKTSRPKPLQWRGEGTILLVDDEDAVKTVTATMLTRTGFSVIKADDGRQALDLFREHSAAIVCTVLDLTMPRMDGRETLTRLREINPRLPVLLCSGYDEQQAGINLSETPGVAFIQKPFRTPVFLAKLKELLDKSAAGH